MRFRTTLPGILSLMLLAALVLHPATAAQPGEVRVTLFHDTHLHGNLEGQNDVTLAHFVGYLNSLRQAIPNESIFVGNGDDLAPSLMSSIFRGQHIVESFNAAGLAYDTFGNHEFDFGPEHLRDMIALARYPYVSANVRDRATGDAFASDLGVKKWDIREISGVRFGFTGLASEETPELTTLGPNTTVLRPIDAMREVLPEMRAAGAQIVVVLSHMCGGPVEQLVTAVDGIDIVVGDHCSTVLDQPIVVNGAIISRRGDELRFLGQLDLVISDGRIASWSYIGHPISATLPVDPTLAEIHAGYRAQLDASLAEEIGVTTTALDANRNTVRGRESTAGNLLADAMRDWGQTDVALTNGGGIRGERLFGPGTLTKRDVAEILPFANYGVVLRITGTQLWEALENGVSQVEEGGGRFPQVSGLGFVYNPAAPVGARVREVFVGAQLLDPAASYTLVTNDFMAGGGDGYAMFRDAEVIIPAGGGPLLTTLLIDYIQIQGTVSPTEEGRIRTTS
jgi:2',3'-cyclic-nucleotide 2'-phosphodiesterase (5'-nucleotidase family)